MRKNDADSIYEIIENNSWLHFTGYADGMLLLIWIPAKSSRILAISILEFK